MTPGEHLTYCISFALSRAQKVVRGLWIGLTEKAKASVVEAHSTPNNFTEAHNLK
jgi:hypothetical protein